MEYFFFNTSQVMKFACPNSEKDLKPKPLKIISTSPPKKIYCYYLKKKKLGISPLNFKKKFVD